MMMYIYKFYLLMIIFIFSGVFVAVVMIKSKKPTPKKESWRSCLENEIYLTVRQEKD